MANKDLAEQIANWRPLKKSNVSGTFVVYDKFATRSVRNAHIKTITRADLSQPMPVPVAPSIADAAPRRLPPSLLRRRDPPAPLQERQANQSNAPLPPLNRGPPTPSNRGPTPHNQGPPTPQNRDPPTPQNRDPPTPQNRDPPTPQNRGPTTTQNQGPPPPQDRAPTQYRIQDLPPQFRPPPLARPPPLQPQGPPLPQLRSHLPPPPPIPPQNRAPPPPAPHPPRRPGQKYTQVQWKEPLDPKNIRGYEGRELAVFKPHPPFLGRGRMNSAATVAAIINRPPPPQAYPCPCPCPHKHPHPYPFPIQHPSPKPGNGPPTDPPGTASAGNAPSSSQTRANVNGFVHYIEPFQMQLMQAAGLRPPPPPSQPPPLRQPHPLFRKVHPLDIDHPALPPPPPPPTPPPPPPPPKRRGRPRKNPPPEEPVAPVPPVKVYKKRGPKPKPLSERKFPPPSLHPVRSYTREFKLKIINHIYDKLFWVVDHRNNRPVREGLPAQFNWRPPTNGEVARRFGLSTTLVGSWWKRRKAILESRAKSLRLARRSKKKIAEDRASGEAGGDGTAGTTTDAAGAGVAENTPGGSATAEAAEAGPSDRMDEDEDENADENEEDEDEDMDQEDEEDEEMEDEDMEENAEEKTVEEETPENETMQEEPSGGEPTEAEPTGEEPSGEEPTEAETTEVEPTEHTQPQ